MQLQQQPIGDVRSLVEVVLRLFGPFGEAFLGGVFNDANRNPHVYAISYLGPRTELRKLGEDAIPRVGQAVTAFSYGTGLSDEIRARFPELNSSRRTGIAEVVSGVQLLPQPPGAVEVMVEVTIGAYMIRLREGVPMGEYLGVSVFDHRA